MQPKSPFWFFPSKKTESLLQKQIDIISKIPKVMTIMLIIMIKVSTLLGITLNKGKFVFFKNAKIESDIQNQFVFCERQYNVAVSSGVRLPGIWGPGSPTC